MNILCVFGYPITIGGHFKSCFSMIEKLSGSEFNFFIATSGYSNEVLEMVKNKINDIYVVKNLRRREPLFNFLSLINIIKICKKQKIDIIHAQDFKSLAPSIFVAYFLNIKLLYTKAGGPLNLNLPPKNIYTVVFSQELYDGMVHYFGFKKNKLSLIKARIDVEKFKYTKPSLSFLEKYNLSIKYRNKIIVAIRMTSEKKDWIDSLFHLIKLFSNEEMDMKFIIAGGGNLLGFYKDEGARINQFFKKEIIQFIGPVFGNDDLIQLYSYADLVMGHGRGILEAMACGKSVVVLNKNGTGEFVSDKNVNIVSKFNFSGRHYGSSYEPCNLQRDIKNFFVDEIKKRKLIQFGSKYIKNEMDSHIGALQIKKIYYEKDLKLKSSYIFFWWFLINALRSIRNALSEFVKKIFAIFNR